jgi:hypothetical protein
MPEEQESSREPTVATVVGPARRCRVWPAVLAATLAAAGLFLLWRFDPRAAAVPICGLYRTTGLYCPGCGATRATHDLLHGHVLLAMHNNALWVLGLPVFLYAVASETRRMYFGRPLPGDPLRNRRFLVCLALVTLVFGVLRNIGVEPCTLLAPT